MPITIEARIAQVVRVIRDLLLIAERHGVVLAWKITIRTVSGGILNLPKKPAHPDFYSSLPRTARSGSVSGG